MKEAVHIGDKTIVLLSRDFEEDIDLDSITSIDYSNLYGEAVTVSALLNKIGMLKSDAESCYAEEKLSCDIYEASLKKDYRAQALRKGGKVVIDGEEIKITDKSLEDLVFSDKEFQIKKRSVISAKRVLDYLDSIYWAIQAKDKKLNNILPKVTPQEFVNELIEGEINTFYIKKFKE